MSTTQTSQFVPLHKTPQTVRWFRENKAYDREESAHLQLRLSQDRCDLVIAYISESLAMARKMNGYNYFHRGAEDYEQMVYGLRRAARVVASACELSQPQSTDVIFERDAAQGGPLLLSGPYHAVHLGQYIDAVWSAMIVRDAGTLARLARTNLAHIHTGGTTIPEGVAALAHALQSWLNKAPDASRQALAAMKANGPTQQHPAGTMNYAVMCQSPAAELLFLLQSPNESRERLSEALVQALEGHKQYYTLAPDTPGGAGEPDDSQSYLCLHALGFACALHDRNVPLAVESDYLPGPMVRGSAIKP
jgi:Immunity protein 49